jgi:hypothetical protein
MQRISKMMTLKKSDVGKMQAYLLSKKPRAIDKKVEYGPKLDKSAKNGKKNKKKTKVY